MKYVFALFFAILYANIAMKPSRATDPTLLGGLHLNGYCQYLGKIEAFAEDNSTWACKPDNSTINMTEACKWQYNSPHAYALQTDSGSPYSWRCYINSSSPSPSTSPIMKSLKIFDANHTLLGLYADRLEYFDLKMQKFVAINPAGGIGPAGSIGRPATVYFDVINCVGTPYKQHLGSSDVMSTQDLYRAGDGRFFSIIQDTPTVTIDIKSYINIGTGSCSNDPSSQPGLKQVEFVTPIATNPVALPLKYAYE